MKIIIIVVLIMWGGSAVLRTMRKLKADTGPVPDYVVADAKQLETRTNALRRTASEPRFDWTYGLSVLGNEVETHEYGEFEEVATARRPDGKFAASIMREEDPDFPELWIFDLQNKQVHRLDSDSWIDWPGNRICWPRNDLSPIVFDYLNGRTRLTVSLEDGDFSEERVDYRDDELVSEEWFLAKNTNKGATWSRLRAYSDDSVQTFFGCESVPLMKRPAFGYTYDVGYKQAKTALLGNHARIRVNRKSLPVVDRAAGALDSVRVIDKQTADQLDALLRSGKVRLPIGDSDEQIGSLMMQSLEG
jgi:hypothetical protein